MEGLAQEEVDGRLGDFGRNLGEHHVDNNSHEHASCDGDIPANHSVLDVVHSGRQEDRADGDEEREEVEGALAAFLPGLAAGDTALGAWGDLFLGEPSQTRQDEDGERGQGVERKDATGVDVRLGLADGAAADDAADGVRTPRKGLEVRGVHGRVLRSFRNGRVDDHVGRRNGVVGNEQEEGREAERRLLLNRQGDPRKDSQSARHDNVGPAMIPKNGQSITHQTIDRLDVPRQVRQALERLRGRRLQLQDIFQIVIAGHGHVVLAKPLGKPIDTH